MRGKGQPRGEVGTKDQRAWVGSCAAIISSYFSLAETGKTGHLDEAPTVRGATYTQSSHSPPHTLYTLFLPTLNCFTAVLSHGISLLLEGETYCYQIPSPHGGSNSYPSPVKYAGFPTPLPGAMFSSLRQITLILEP